MRESDDYMSGRNQGKGNNIALLVGMSLLAALIVAYIFLG